MAASCSPASFSTKVSSSKNSSPRRWASARPIVLLPAPRRPTRATTRRSVRSCCAANNSSPAEDPSARATSWRRATEMFPCPPSRSARNRSETPLRCASSRRVRPRSSRRRRAAPPTEDSRTWCSRFILLHYNASALTRTSNIVLALAQALRYPLADGHDRARPEAAVRHPSLQVPPLDAGRGGRRRAPDHEGPALRRCEQRGRAEEQQLRPERG